MWCLSSWGVWWAGKEEAVDGKEEASKGRLLCRIDVPTLVRDAALWLARVASIGWLWWCIDGVVWWQQLVNGVRVGLAEGVGGQGACFVMHHPCCRGVCYDTSVVIAHSSADLCGVVWCG